MKKLRISGKNILLPSLSSGPSHRWSFEARPGGWVIALSDTGERKRFMLSEIKRKMSVSLRGFLWSGESLEQSDAISSGSGTGSISSSDADLVAQFPGKVRKILIAQGATVQEGDPLVLIEAMKMEFVVRAPFSGIVSEVWVVEGQQVLSGDRFVDLKLCESLEEYKDGH